MTILNVNELDFEQIKANLKSYFEASEDFSDYNFSGSALDTMLDVLAYNTHYNAVLTHLLANESFLDTAIKRSSVTSLAQSLGYLPRSVRSSRAKVEASISPSPSYTNQTATISRNTKFTSSNADGSFLFVPKQDYTASLQTVDGVSTFEFAEIELIEGNRVENSFFARGDSLSGPFVLPNQDIDTTTIRVRVQENRNSFLINSWTQYDNILEADGDTEAFFVTEGVDGLLEIRFGDDINGKKLTLNNVVIVDYIVSNGKVSNGSNVFSMSAQITGSGESVTVNLLNAATAGANRETVDTIKRNAPLYNSTKNRAVTAKDYEILIKNSNSSIQSVAVWGGEDNIPPIYGKIFISLQPREGSVITLNDKNTIINNVIAPKATVTVIPEFVDPEYSYVGLDIRVTFDVTKTVATSATIEQLVRNAVDNYFVNDLNVLGKSFYISRVHDAIKSVSNAILSVSISPTIQKRLLPTLDIYENYVVNFNAKLQPRYLKSSWFNMKDANGSNFKAYLTDTPLDGTTPKDYSGVGTVVAKKVADDTTLANVGTINYDTGRMELTNLYIDNLYSTEQYLRLTTDLHDYSYDIESNLLVSRTETSSGAVYPNPATNIILTKNDSAVDNVAGVSLGINVVMQPRDPEL